MEEKKMRLPAPLAEAQRFYPLPPHQGKVCGERQKKASRLGIPEIPARTGLGSTSMPAAQGRKPRYSLCAEKPAFRIFPILTSVFHTHLLFALSARSAALSFSISRDRGAL